MQKSRKAIQNLNWEQLFTRPGGTSKRVEMGLDLSVSTVARLGTSRQSTLRSLGILPIGILDEHSVGTTSKDTLLHM